MSKREIIVPLTGVYCKGGCGRLLSDTLTPSPNHVLRYKDGFCASCYDWKSAIEGIKKALGTHKK